MIEKVKRSRDLRDALISALVGLCYIRGDCLRVVRGREGVIYLISRLPT